VVLRQVTSVKIVAVQGALGFLGAVSALVVAPGIRRRPGLSPFGVYLFVGSFLGGLALVIVLPWRTRRQGQLPVLKPSHYHALGRLLLEGQAMLEFARCSQYAAACCTHGSARQPAC
jgi:hypothetical protein